MDSEGVQAFPRRWFDEIGGFDLNLPAAGATRTPTCGCGRSGRSASSGSTRRLAGPPGPSAARCPTRARPDNRAYYESTKATRQVVRNRDAHRPGGSPPRGSRVCGSRGSSTRFGSGPSPCRRSRPPSRLVAAAAPGLGVPPLDRRQPAAARRTPACTNRRRSWRRRPTPALRAVAAIRRTSTWTSISSACETWSRCWRASATSTATRRRATPISPCWPRRRATRSRACAWSGCRSAGRGEQGQILEETGPEFFRRAILDYIGDRRLHPFVDPRSGRVAGNRLDPRTRQAAAVGPAPVGDLPVLPWRSRGGPPCTRTPTPSTTGRRPGSEPCRSRTSGRAPTTTAS